MAIHANSTTAPSSRRGFLRGVAALPVMAAPALASSPAAHEENPELLRLYREWVLSAARCDELDEILLGPMDVYPDDSPAYKAADRESREIHNANIELRRRILAIPAVTALGVGIKLRMFEWCTSSTTVEEDVERALSEGDGLDTTIANVIALDLKRLRMFPVA